MKPGNGRTQHLSLTGLLNVVQRLRDETAIAAQLGGSPKQAWLNWLSGYIRRGDHGLRDQVRDAGLIYSRLEHAPMIIWLAEASGVGRPLIHQAAELARKGRNSPSLAAAIRRLLPWSLVVRHLRQLDPENSNDGRDHYAEHLGNAVHLPEEMPTGEEFEEGAATQMLVNRYERDPAARERCLQYYGTNCMACGISLADRYGPEVAGLIHVHHLTPLANVGVQSSVDPVRDLRPVCPNCHAVIHSARPARTIDQVKAMMRRRNCRDDAQQDRP